MRIGLLILSTRTRYNLTDLTGNGICVMFFYLQSLDISRVLAKEKYLHSEKYL